MNFCSEKLTNLAVAMLKVQKQLRTALKDSYNGFTQSKYATLNSVMDACSEVLIDAGILVMQYPVQVEGNGSLLGLVAKLIHAESGEWQESLLLMPLPKADPQGYGLALTYARRYGLSSMIGLVTEDDDDANMACQGYPSGIQDSDHPEFKKPQLACMLHEHSGFANQRIFLAGTGRVVIIFVENLKFVHSPSTPIVDL